MKIFVAGCEGSLMQAVIPILLERGCDVVGVDSFSRHGRIERKRSYTVVEGDLADRSLVREAIGGCDGVIQAAARVYGIMGFHRYPADILALDMLVHHNVLWEALDAGIQKIAYISSSMVYERCLRHPSHEEQADESLVPMTEYGLSKLVGERLTRAFYKQYGLNYVIWRPFNIITPFEEGEDELGMAHVFADFVRGIIVERKNPLPIIGDGHQIRCFTWIQDVAQAIAEFTFDRRTDSEAFNLGNPQPVEMERLAQIIFEAGHRRGVIPQQEELKFEHLPAPADDVRVRIPSVEKAQKVLGWAAVTRLEEAVEECIEAAISRYGANSVAGRPERVGERIQKSQGVSGPPE